MELFKLLGTIAIQGTDEAKKAVGSVTESAESASSKISSAFGKIGKAAVTVGKTIAVGVGAGVTAISALTKKSLDAYADYEQLVGGVETLFGAGGQSLNEYAASVGKTVAEVTAEYTSLMKAQNTVLANADAAYKTAGMSANEYMETVTSFSAALINSLGGDTEAAAKKADQAIVDMADNANKMGTSIESIQTAYQGFAKQNYTMLDNLKLGYGGTQQEMARLLEDAAKIDESFKPIFSIDAKGHLEAKYSDIVDAIHIVQTEMGITGTTAKEASSTISGSLSSMKSAWSNLVAGFGDDNANLSVLIDNFVESAEIALDNVIPRIQLILVGVSDAIAKFVPIIAKKLPGLIETLLPSLIQGAVALLNGLISALPAILQILIEQIPFILSEISQALIDAFPLLIETFQELFQQLWDYIAVELLNTGATFEETCSFVSEIFSNLWAVLQSVWETIGKPIWDGISYCIDVVKNVFSTNMPAIMGFFQTAIQGIVDTWNNHLKPALDAIGNFLNTVLMPIFEAVFQGFILPIVTSVFQGICDLWNNTLKPVFDGICDFLTGVFTLNFDKALTGILNIATGIFNGILTAIETPMNTAKEIVNGVIDFIKEKFDFNWEFPKLKMPHFTITGSFSLDPPSVPSFGIDWYAKAMDNPMIMTKPTAFGINSLGQIKVGGDAGSEVVSGTETLMNMIKEAVAVQNASLAERFDRLLEFLMSILPQMLENMGYSLVLDSGALVGELAPGIDDELGRIASRKDRQ